MLKKHKKLIFIVLLIVLSGAAVTGYFIHNSKAESAKDEEKQLIYEDPSLNLGNVYHEPSPEEDSDGDGLINSEEEKYRTDINNVDTDWDGLSDFYEIMESKTDPLNPDTDRDGLNDNVELLAGLDPNNEKTVGMIPDSMKTFDVVKSDERVKLFVKGNASVYDVYAGIYNATGLSNTPGLVSNVYEFYLEKPFHEAEVTFNYSDNELNSLGIDENNLSIFWFTNEGEFKKVNSFVDPGNNTVTAKLHHFSKYVLGDGTIINTDLGAKVMLLIDNSGSMYPKELLAESDENDVDFKRLDMANALIDYAGDSILFGAAKFTGTYTGISKIGTDAETLKAKINEIRTINETFDGTYIASSIKSALSEFEADDYKNRKYIVLLTDGVTTEDGWSYDEDDAIRDCINKHVTVIVVGLGNYTDVQYLQKIASGTGGIYLHATNADALESIYKEIFHHMNYAKVEFEDDGVVREAIAVADSGFKSNLNGFSFENYCILYDGEYINGQCFGLAAFAQKFYLGKVLATGEPFSAKMGGILNSSHINTTAPAYDLTDTGVLDISNLHDYTNKWLDRYNELCKTPSIDKYYIDDNVLKFTEAYNKRIQDSGCEYFVIKPIKKKGNWGEDKYTSYESLVLDVNAYIDSGKDDPEMDFITSILWYFCHQSNNLPKDTVKEVKLSVGSDMSSFIAYVSQGIPVILNDKKKGHAINVTRILRDIDDPNKYYVEIYDNNTENSCDYYTVNLKKIGLIDSMAIDNWGEDRNCKTYNTDGDKVAISFSIVY